MEGDFEGASVLGFFDGLTVGLFVGGAVPETEHDGVGFAECTGHPAVMPDPKTPFMKCIPPLINGS